MDDLVFTNLTLDRVDDAHRLEHDTFDSIHPDDLYGAEEMADTVRAFPAGNFMALDPAGGHRLVAIGMGILVDFDPSTGDLGDIESGDGAAAHSSDHAWYYGSTIAVDPDYRGRGVGRQLYALRKHCVQQLNKAGIVAGGVLPGYKDHVGRMTADDYIEKVKTGELYDPTLSFQLSEGFRAVRAVCGYMRDDTVGDQSVLIIWDNPLYRPDRTGTDGR